eukprot:gene21248-41256_t
MGKKVYVNSQENIKSLPLPRALESSGFHGCLSICIGVSLPVLFDLVIDLYLQYANKRDPVRLAVWVMFLSLVFPNLITYFYVIPTAQFDIFPSILKARFGLLFICVIFIINGYGPSIWTWKLILLSGIPAIVAQ